MKQSRDDAVDVPAFSLPLTIRQYPDPILRCPAKTVDVSKAKRATQGGDNLQKLADEMFRYVRDEFQYKFHSNSNMDTHAEWLARRCRCFCCCCCSSNHEYDHDVLVWDELTMYVLLYVRVVCMYRVMYATNGCGLAAPQVGISVRVMVFNETGKKGEGMSTKWQHIWFLLHLIAACRCTELLMMDDAHVNCACLMTQELSRCSWILKLSSTASGRDRWMKAVSRFQACMRMSRYERALFTHVHKCLVYCSSRSSPMIIELYIYANPIAFVACASECMRCIYVHEDH